MYNYIHRNLLMTDECWNIRKLYSSLTYFDSSRSLAPRLTDRLTIVFGIGGYLPSTYQVPELYVHITPLTIRQNTFSKSSKCNSTVLAISNEVCTLMYFYIRT